LRVCDRCGRRVDVEPKLADFFKDFVEEAVARMVLGEVDLCMECMEEFHKLFRARVSELREELQKWLKHTSQATPSRAHRW